MKKKFTSSAITLFFFCCFHFNTLAQNGIVKGKTTYNNEILSGATVSLGNKTVLSDVKGEFTLSIPPGKYMLTVSYAGYKPFQNEITITDGSVQHFDITLEPLDKSANVIVIGSRSVRERSYLNTPVPVDVVQFSKLPAREVDLTRILTYTIPSFNAHAHGFGSGKNLVPASLRGLGPDQTLVLLNGRRLHSMAIPWTQGVTGFGTVGTDLNAISSAAIEAVEVLRDGASAQYGSDAIAGVINLQLKKANQGTLIQLHTGQYYKGDGESISFSINQGTVFLKKGFLNITAHIRYHNQTQRQGIYDGPIYYNIPSNATQAQIDNIRLLDEQMIEERGFDRLNHRPIGDNKIWNTGLVLNGGMPLSSTTNFSWTAAWNNRFVKDQNSSAGYRYPKDSATMTNTRIYPDGFLPILKSKIPDISLIGGVDGRTKSGWKWNAAMTYGKNSTQIDILNTNNASQYLQGLDVQRNFYTGKQSFSQMINNIDFTKVLSDNKNGLFLNIAIGAEFRIDHYSIQEGDEASWQNYAPGSGRLGGSQGLAGFQPDNAVNKSRQVAGGYAEIEMEKNEKLLMNVATRYEHYSDYGSNLAGKFALRYKISKRINWRASFSNGFRAPSLQQRYYSLVTTATATGNVIVRSGTFRNDSKIATAFGVHPLEAEKALNFSSGFTSSVSKNISLTIDAYWIQIKNRIIYSGNIPSSLPDVLRILIDNNLSDIRSLRLFSNAINTRTLGLDIVLIGNWILENSSLELSLAANFNKTSLYGAIQYARNLPDDSIYRNLLVNREERCRVETSFPMDKVIFNIKYLVKKWKLNLNFTRYGKIEQRGNDPVNFPDEVFSPKILTSLNICYKIRQWLSITAGAENITDIYPDKQKNRSNTVNGLLPYSFNFAAFGTNGGYYFLNMSFDLKRNKKSHP